MSTQLSQEIILQKSKGKESVQNKSSPNFVCYFEDEHLFSSKNPSEEAELCGSIEATTWSAKRSKVGQNIGDFLPKIWQTWRTIFEITIIYDPIVL